MKQYPFSLTDVHSAWCKMRRFRVASENESFRDIWGEWDIEKWTSRLMHQGKMTLNQADRIARWSRDAKPGNVFRDYGLVIGCFLVKDQF